VTTALPAGDSGVQTLRDLTGTIALHAAIRPQHFPENLDYLTPIAYSALWKIVTTLK
jgi:hypothetical protein